MKPSNLHPMTETAPLRTQAGNGLYPVTQWNNTRNGQTSAPYARVAHPNGYDTNTDLDGMHMAYMGEDEEEIPLQSRQAAAAWSPILLLAVGPLAETIAAATTDAGTQWQPHRPPLRTITRPTADPAARDPQIVGRQLDAFCAQLRTTTLTRGAWQETGDDQPLQSWLLLDLYVNEQGEVADTLINRRINDAIYLLQSFTTATCRHLSAPHSAAVPPPQLLLIADPSRPDDRQRCQQRLAALLADPIYVVGSAPDNVERAAWQEQVATALAALLWVVPSGAHTEPTMANTHSVYTIGAATSPLPTAGMIRLLGLLAAHEAVTEALTRLNEMPARAEGGTAPTNALSPLITELLNNAAALHAAVPPPAPMRLRRTASRRWRATANPLQTLLAHAYRQQQPDRTAIREARRHWLTTQLATWSAACAADSHASAPAAQTGPLQLLPAATLEGMRQQILTAAQSIEDELAAVTAAAEQRERTLQAHRHSVGNFCATLPTFTIDGLWYGLRHPRRWLGWAYQLTFGLAQRLRLLSKQLTMQQQILHREANLHLRRQLALAMLQDVQQQVAWRRKLATHLAALQHYLDDQVTAALEQVSLPLDRQQSARL